MTICWLKEYIPFIYKVSLARIGIACPVIFFYREKNKMWCVHPVGFEPRPSVYEENRTWVGRLRPLGHGCLHYIYIYIILYITNSEILTRDLLFTKQMRCNSLCRRCWHSTLYIIELYTRVIQQKKSHSALTVPEWSPTSVLGKPNDA